MENHRADLLVGYGVGLTWQHSFSISYVSDGRVGKLSE